MAICQGVVIIFGLAYLFYNSLTATLVLLPVLVLYFRDWFTRRTKKKEQEFREQFKDGMQIMASTLNIGYSVENAVIEATKDLKRLYPNDSRIIREFKQIIHQLEINISIEQAFNNFLGRVEQEDVENFVAVFSVAKRMGGESIEVLKTTAHTISEKIEVEKEIQTMLGAKELEFNIMSLIPFGIILYMRMTFSDFMGVLYGNILGIGIMSSCLVIYFFAFMMGRRLIKIEV